MEAENAPEELYQKMIRTSPFLSEMIEGNLQQECSCKEKKAGSSTEMEYEDEPGSEDEEEVDFPEGDEENEYENNGDDDETAITDQWPERAYETEGRSPLLQEVEPVAVPKDNPIPFAPIPATGSFWPIITAHSIGKKREVAFCAINGKCKYPGKNLLRTGIAANGIMWALICGPTIETRLLPVKMGRSSAFILSTMALMPYSLSIRILLSIMVKATEGGGPTPSTSTRSTRR